MLLDRQRGFARAVLLDDPGVFPATADDHLRRRLEVHRNTVCTALAGVLESAFPLVARTLGPDGFRTAARAFVAIAPPRRATLFAYGDAFPAFLSAMPALAEPDWLGDLARLEWACNAALFAADVPRFDPQAFAADADAAAIAALRLAPAPDVALVRSAHPIVSIRAALDCGDTPVAAGAEDALVWRTAGAVKVRALARDEADFLESLFAGRTLAEAAAAGGENFDPGPALAAAFADGLFAAAAPTEEPTA